MDLPLAAALLERWVRWRTRRRPVQPLQELDLAGVDRVLLVLTTGLGDAVLSTPIFDAVRRGLPKARIGLFVRSAWAPLFQAETDLDEVIPYPGKWRRFRETLRALKAFSPQLTLVLHGNDPDILPLAYLAGSRFIVRIPTSGTRYPWLLSNAGREADRSTLPDRHYIENRLRILDSVGLVATRSAPVLRIKGSEDVQTWIKEAREGSGYLVVHPWAADAYKTWPADKARQMLEMLPEVLPGVAVILTGSAQNRAAALALAEGLGHVRSAAGLFDIRDTGAILAGAMAVVAPDTGVLHMAAALDTPTVGLYSPTRPDLVGQRAETAGAIRLTLPLTCDPCTEKKCPHTPALCMARFEPEQVLEALRSCLRTPA